jgi:cyclopropane fatty-acyl-phospholipid synthase-like methyltransferase
VALDWAAGDGLRDFLDLPRHMAVAVAAADLPEVNRIVDVGSGPGDFLAVALERCPAASGLWIDLSPAMQTLARARLSGYAGRVQFALSGLDRLDRIVPAGSADLIVSSRVTHHLGVDGLAAFYAGTAIALRPGGWLANLDHISIREPWTARLRQARCELVAPNQPGHAHDRPLPTVDQHLAALTAAGFTDSDVPWRAFSTVLILAKSPTPEGGHNR